MTAAEQGETSGQGIALFANTKRKRKNTKRSEPPEPVPKHAKHEQLQQEEPQQPQEPAEPAGPGPSSLSLQERAESFRALGLSEHLCTVCQTLGMQRPTQVQTGCIPAILAGKDVVGVAQTGSGKTAAFALPILQRLARDPYGVFALVLTPTRELAIQISEQFQALGAGTSLRQCVVIGGVDMQAQARELSRRPHVVIATPGRLRGLLDTDGSLAAVFKRTAFLVMDEADRVLDATFEDDLRALLPALPPGDQRQTLLFSATMTQALIKLQQNALDDAFVFEAYQGLRTADKLKEQYIFIPNKVKEVYLTHLLERLSDLKVRSAILFCSTCKGCELLSLVLKELGFPCAALHSGRPQKQRLAALASFKSEAVPLLLATDVASRGLDIPTVDLVINYDLPMLARDYVHRVGRTARAGRGGWALSFVTQYDVKLVHSIEELIGHQLSEYSTDEAEVLKGITRVYAAKRAAMLAAAEAEGVNTKDKRIRRLAKQL